jgi:hypothetical protein
MKYFVNLSSQQKQFLAREYCGNYEGVEECAEYKRIIDSFDDSIESSELQEYFLFLLDYIYLDLFKTEKKKAEELNKQFGYPINKENIKASVIKEHRRIKANTDYMPINTSIETLMDIICHTSYEWMDVEKIFTRKSVWSDQEIERNEAKKALSFAKKIIKPKSIPVANNIPSTSNNFPTINMPIETEEEEF